MLGFWEFIQWQALGGLESEVCRFYKNLQDGENQGPETRAVKEGDSSTYAGVPRHYTFLYTLICAYNPLSADIRKERRSVGRGIQRFGALNVLHGPFSLRLLDLQNRIPNLSPQSPNLASESPK